MQRTLHDLGDLVSERPRDVRLTYSQHHCCKCKIYFNADMLDLAPPKSHYTHRVIALAVRLVVEDGLPYLTRTSNSIVRARVYTQLAVLFGLNYHAEFDEQPDYAKCRHYWRLALAEAPEKIDNDKSTILCASTR